MPGLGRGLHMLVGLDEADQQRVDQHVVRRAFACDSTLVNAMPAARVIEVGALPRARRLGADIEHVDDPAPAPLLHLRPDQPRQPDGGEQLLVEVVAASTSSVIFSNAPVREVPALFTTMSILPNAAMASS